MLLRVAYVGVLLAAAAVSAGVAYWLVSRRDWCDARFLVVHLLTSAVWAVVAAAELLLDPFSLVRVAVLGATAVSMLNVATWGLFVVDYLRIPDARARRYRQAIGAVSALVIGLILTNPIHGRYYTEITPAADPFPHPVLVEGPLVAVGFGSAYLIAGVGLYGMLRLFIRSRFRSNAAALLLIGGTLVALVPSVVSNLGLAPLSGYDHAVFGTPVFATAVAVAAFRTGLPDLSTVARQRLLEEMDDALVAVDADGVVTDHNPPAVDLAAGPDPAEEPFAEVFPSVAADLDLADEPTTATLSLSGDDGTRYYSARTTPLVEGERSLGHLLLLRDVTELERSRRQLKRQNEYLDRFASMLSHELRNPLEIVDGYAGALEDELDLDGPPERMLGEIREANDRMTEIVSDLRTLAEGGVSVESTERVRLSEAVDGVDTPVDVVVERDGVVHADASRLATVFENLLRNAADHVGPDATVTVGLTADGEGFYVEDDGPGIPGSDREQVFSYGYTTSEDGSGIGLALVRVTADAHGWTVRLAPQSSDRGARFVFEGVSVDPVSSGGTAHATGDDAEFGLEGTPSRSPSSGH